MSNWSGAERRQRVREENDIRGAYELYRSLNGRVDSFEGRLVAVERTQGDIIDELRAIENRWFSAFRIAIAPLEKDVSKLVKNEHVTAVAAFILICISSGIFALVWNLFKR